MIKKLIILLAAILVMQNVTFAYELKYIEESDSVEESAKRLLNGEFVPIVDLFRYPEQSYSSFGVRNAALSAEKKMYDQLNNVEKDIYDGINANIDVTKDGVSGFTFTAAIPLSKGYSYRTSEGRTAIAAEYNNYISNTIGYEITRSAYALVAYDHPEYFWLDPSRLSLGTTASYSNYDSATGEMTISCTLKPIEGNDNYYTLCYGSLEQVENDINKCNEAINSIINSFPENASDYYKVHIINEWLLENNSYNHLKNKSDYAYIAPGALIYGRDEDSAKHAVCEAYAEAFKMICDKAGINCLNGEAFHTIIVKNDKGEDEEVKEGHKWNLLCLDGNWYFYDATWNDVDSSMLYYKTKYLAIGTDTASVRDTTYAHGTDSAQLGFTILAMPQQKDYLETKGLENDILIYDINGDNYITKADCAAGLRSILNNEFSKDINNDSQYDLTDIVSYLGLLYN